MKQQEQQQEIASLRSQLQEALRLKQVASSRSATLEKAMVVNGSREPQVRATRDWDPAVGWCVHAWEALAFNSCCRHSGRHRVTQSHTERSPLPCWSKPFWSMGRGGAGKSATLCIMVQGERDGGGGMHGNLCVLCASAEGVRCGSSSMQDPPLEGMRLTYMQAHTDCRASAATSACLNLLCARHLQMSAPSAQAGGSRGFPC